MPVQKLFLWFELASLLIACINYHKIKNSILWWFIPFLLIINIVEWGNYFRLYTFYCRVYTIRSTNNWIFNFMVCPLQYAFYGWFYYNILASLKDKKNMCLLGVVLFTFAIINIAFIQKGLYFNSYTYVLGCIYIAYGACLYLRQLMQSEEDQTIWKTTLFWVSAGCLLFYSCQAFLWSFFEYFLKTNRIKLYSPIFLFFTNILNIMLYSCLSIGFFWKKPANIS